MSPEWLPLYFKHGKCPSAGNEWIELMRYELDLIRGSCRQIGWAVHDVHLGIEVDLGDGAILCFQNADRYDDCLIGFAGMPWHVHDHLRFAGARGYHTEVDYRELPSALSEGRVLIAALE